MKRRDILKSALAVSCLPLIPGSAFAQPLGAAPPQRFIDIHCHFFNAADLPIKGFVQIVVLGDYERLQALPEKFFGIEPFSVWKGLAALLTDFLIKGSAPSPADELNCLRDGTACRGVAVAADAKLTAETEKSDAASLERGKSVLGDVLKERYGAAAVTTDETNKALDAASGDIDPFIDFVLQEMKTENKSRPGLTAKDLRENKTEKLFIIDDIIGFITSGKSKFSRYFSWGELLISYRTIIARQYAKIYSSSKYKLSLATPALVDFNHWLNDDKNAALKDQTDVMSFISARSSFPLHCFAPYDPLRDVRPGAQPQSSLATVQRAIREHGFLGVKLYSPMGFRPRDNGVRPISFPEHLGRLDPDFGNRLDGALNGLYAWCHSEDVPILAHTLNSQESNRGFGLRAEPKFWRQVLTEFPNLRLNLAHFGHFTLAFAQGGDAAGHFDKTWEFQIGQFIAVNKFRNVFADISYLGTVLGPDMANAAYVETVKRLFSRYISQFDPEVKSLLFGTDWSMIARAEHFEAYLENVDKFFRQVGLKPGQIDNLFYGNAMRYLGLSETTRAVERLRAFYQANRKPMPQF